MGPLKCVIFFIIVMVTGKQNLSTGKQNLLMPLKEITSTKETGTPFLGTQLLKTSCSSDPLSSTEYDSQTEAYDACLNDRQCHGYYDRSCDDQGHYKLCKEQSTWRSSSSSCVWSTEHCVDKAQSNGSPWYDSDGPVYDCNWYSTDTRCEFMGNLYSNFGMTANQACCTCAVGHCFAWEWNGGTLNHQELFINGSQSPHTMQQCSKWCANTPTCSAFFLGTSASEAPGACHLYRQGCVYSPTSHWKYYKLTPCQAVGRCSAWEWTGGCLNHKEFMITGSRSPHTLQQCSDWCADTPTCSTFFFGTSANLAPGACDLYRQGCVYSPTSHWNYYKLIPCPAS